MLNDDIFKCTKESCVLQLINILISVTFIEQ